MSIVFGGDCFGAKREPHDEGYSHVCRFCGSGSEEFETKEDCLEHICYWHLGEAYSDDFVDTKCKKVRRKWKCLECNNMFTQKGSVKEHLEGIHLKIGYKCKDCGAIVTTLGHFRTHKREGRCKRKQEKKIEKKEDYSYVCRFCRSESEEFKTKEDCLEHICYWHLDEAYSDDFVATKCEKVGDKWKCLECNKVFAQKGGVKEHLEGVHLKIGYKCKDCGAIRAAFGSFRKHKSVEGCKREQEKSKRCKGSQKKLAQQVGNYIAPVINDLVSLVEYEGGHQQLGQYFDGKDNVDQGVDIQDSYVYPDCMGTDGLGDVGECHGNEQPERFVCEYCGEIFDVKPEQGLFPGIAKKIVEISKRCFLKHLCELHLKYPYDEDTKVEDVIEFLIQKVKSRAGGYYFECKWVGCDKWSSGKQKIHDHIANEHLFL
ncbi:MAG: hypothetical protein V1855_03330 [bacterium]